MAKEEQKPTSTAPVNSTEPESGEVKKKGKEKEEDEVSVSKDLLKQILEKQQSQEEAISKLTAENARLASAADKNRLMQYDMEHGGGNLIRRAKISLWDGLPVMGWQTVRDEVGRVDGVLREVQTVKLFCDDGSKNLKEFEVVYLDFARNVKKVEGEIVEQRKTKSGEVYIIELSDGKQYPMDIRFIN